MYIGSTVLLYCTCRCAAYGIRTWGHQSITPGGADTGLNHRFGFRAWVVLSQPFKNLFLHSSKLVFGFVNTRCCVNKKIKKLKLWYSYDTPDQSRWVISHKYTRRYCSITTCFYTWKPTTKNKATAAAAATKLGLDPHSSADAHVLICMYVIT